MSSYRRLAVGLLALTFVACSDESLDIVVDGIDSNEPVLVSYFEELRRATQASPRSAQLRGQLGMAYDANDFFDAAATTYKQAARLDSADFAWPYLQALALSNHGNYADALKAMDGAFALNATNPGAWLLRGNWLLEMDTYADARIAYEQAVALAKDPATSAAASGGLARAMLRQEQPQAAAELLQALTQSFPHPYVQQVLATAYLRLGQSAEAGELLTMLGERPQARLNWPDPISARKLAYVRGFSGQLKVAERLLKNGKGTEALAILTDLRSRESDVSRFPDGRRLYNTMTFAYRVVDRRDLAESVLVEALETYPDFPMFHFTLAVLLAERGDNAGALDRLDLALTLDPTLLAAYDRKFDLLRSARRFDEALAVFDVRMSYGNVATQAYFDAGLVAGTLTRWMLAIGYFEQALVLDPEFARAELFLAHSLASAGKFDAADTALANAARLGIDATDVAVARKRLDDLRNGERQ